MSKKGVKKQGSTKNIFRFPKNPKKGWWKKVPKKHPFLGVFSAIIPKERGSISR